ncbi:MAG: hypothetical protein BWK72_07410 [Rhodoferax ferrireducens]|uniref:Glycosyltransferase subfamily 4-like N-terminal domain-containing protein n=2 Tax=Pseudomonadota TaxID=1224 RepID=A0A1Y1R056_9GAMM|nr:MAG: hypothetical protein BWK72_07410 [Rhodoferax ferrireducens]OQX17490.1 MAG: hypothetical protein BWK73_01180 [Thiothrix lacustris]
MVAFHFPPQAGSSGVLRSLNFVKYLPLQGWQTSVLTASPKAYVQQRNDLVPSIPSDTVVIRAGALDAARHLAIRGKYLRLSALPDRWSTWWLPGVWAGLSEVRRSRPHLIWSTYPIATAHMIGGTLAMLTGLPWVADFRDPMLNSSNPAGALQRRVVRWLELLILRNASACVFTTTSSAQNYRKEYLDFAFKCHVIENGYDDDAFEQAERDKKPREDGRMLMLHSGLIYPADRDPSTFFSAVRQLIDHGDLNAESLCIRFRAPGHGSEVYECAQRHGLEKVVEIAPPVPYQDAIAEMMTANLLLVFQGSNFNAQVPAKIYEYVRSLRPILAVTDPAGETNRQLGQFVGVWTANIASDNSVAAALVNWLASDRLTPEEISLQQNLELVKRYSRRAATAQLGELFERLSR